MRVRLLAPAILSALPLAAFAIYSHTDLGSGSAFPLFDDAMISMTYARTFAEGHGLVWYPGAAHVEGFTNLLWTLWMAVLHWLFGDGPATSLLVVASGFAALLWNLWSLRELGESLDASDGAIRAALLMTGACFPLAFWTARGMEVGLCAALLTATCVEVLRYLRTPRIASLARLVAVTVVLFGLRPEMLVLMAPAWFYALIYLDSRRRILLCHAGAVVSVIVAATTLWRYEYYGDVVPNTFYLKATGADLALRVETGLYWYAATMAFYLLPFALPTLATLPVLARERRGAGLLIAMVATTMAYDVWIGGDAWESLMKFPNRYLCAILPLVCMLCAIALDRVAAGQVRRRHVITSFAVMLAFAVYAALPSAYRAALPDHYSTRQLIALAAGVICCAGIVLAALRQPQQIAPATWRSLILSACVAINLAPITFAVRAQGFAMHVDRRLAREGDLLKRRLPGNATIAVTYAGAICYYSRLRCVDLYGKSDRRIARMPAVLAIFHPGHNKFDLDYSLGEIAPDFVHGVPGNVDIADRYGYKPVLIEGCWLYQRQRSAGLNPEQRP